MELGKELTKPNILRRACNPYGFHIHIIRAIKSMGVYVVRNAEASNITLYALNANVLFAKSIELPTQL